MAAATPAGYSGTPLSKKLGIQQAHRVLLVDAPAAYQDWLQPLPEGVQFVARPDAKVELAHVFVTEKAELAKCLATLRAKLSDEVALWISWPKKAAKVPTTVTEDLIRELALPLGWVDIKVCAVTEVWSGLKLVIRKELRS